MRRLEESLLGLGRAGRWICVNGNRRVDLSRLEVDQTWPWLRRGEAWRGAIRWRGGEVGAGEAGFAKILLKPAWALGWQH